MAQPYSVSDAIYKATGGSGVSESFYWFKTAAAVSNMSSTLSSLWICQGIPSSGAAPGTGGRNPTRTTDGSLLQLNATGGRKKWLDYFSAGTMRCNASNSNYGAITVYDRLYDCSGFSGASVALNTVNGTLTRYGDATSCVGNQLFVEIYGQIGGTPQTLTVNYVNEDGNESATSVVIGGANFQEVGRIVKVPLLSTDSGVRGINSFQLDVSTGVAGDYGITIASPIARVTHSGSGTISNRTLRSSTGYTEILEDACLALMVDSGAVSNLGGYHGMISFVES